MIPFVPPIECAVHNRCWIGVMEDMLQFPRALYLHRAEQDAHYRPSQSLHFASSPNPALCANMYAGRTLGEVVVGCGHLPSGLPADITPQAMRPACVNFGNPFTVATEVASDFVFKFAVSDRGLRRGCAICCVPRIRSPPNLCKIHAVRSRQIRSCQSAEPEPNAFLVDVRNDGCSNSISLYEADGEILPLPRGTEVPAKYLMSGPLILVPLLE